MSGAPYILYLPEVALEKIFSFLSYDEIAKNRVVCSKFNEVSKNMLCRGFVQLEKRHSNIYKKLKALLPRRESERRTHHLARHCDILQAVETRISMLNMTYMKYIDNNMFCFIPGKVLDEMKTVLHLVENEKVLPRTYQLLQEVRDLSSMAMEHFEEHILPKVKEQVERRSAWSYGTTSTCTRIPRLVHTHQSLSNEIYKVKKQSKSHKHNISFLTQSTQKLFRKLRKQNIFIKAQSQKIREQEKRIQEQNVKIQEQEATVADFKKHIEEWDQKYKDLTTKLVRAREDILTVTSQSPSSSSQSLNFRKMNIKPRSSRILPKGYISLDIERKRKSGLLTETTAKRSKQENNTEESSSKVPDLFNFSLDNEKTDDNNSESTKSKFSRTMDFLEAIASLNNPLPLLRNRKRKITEDIDLK